MLTGLPRVSAARMPGTNAQDVPVMIGSAAFGRISAPQLRPG